MEDEGGIKKDFGKLPHWLIDTGIMAKLTGNEVKVLCELVRQTYYGEDKGKGTGTGNVTNEQVAKESGVAYSSITECVKTLEQVGIIKVWYRGWRRYYQILPDFVPKPEAWAIFRRKRDKLPRKSETYRDPITGRFSAENV